MTQEEALAKARELWGKDAIAVAREAPDIWIGDPRGNRGGFRGTPRSLIYFVHPAHPVASARAQGRACTQSERNYYAQNLGIGMSWEAAIADALARQGGKT